MYASSHTRRAGRRTALASLGMNRGIAPSPKQRALRIEPLEARMLLSAISWKGDSGYRTDPNHWSGGVVPGPADDVTIDVPGITVTVSSSAPQSVRSLYSTATLVIDGGSLTTATNSEIASPGAVDVQAGSLYLGGGESTGTFQVAAGAGLGLTGQVLGPTSSVTGAGG